MDFDYHQMVVFRPPFSAISTYQPACTGHGAGCLLGAASTAPGPIHTAQLKIYRKYKLNMKYPKFYTHATPIIVASLMQRQVPTLFTSPEIFDVIYVGRTGEHKSHQRAQTKSHEC